ncbi:tyrosine-type recombinase/integrase [uncultured Alistipes sp.]|jgi:hypothetical protein|uniref:tyrosine-type recombinase/integrase n=1 Tax=uncultured Alistipes sp. TaxID=538949 RepID=UPI0025EF29E2|nr:tyrosine-type recombinase/integrase [uncultured Alistipes sp.]
MGRTKAKYPKGKFVFKNKANGRGERALYLQYIINGTPALTSTGIWVLPSEWDEAKQVVLTKNKSHIRHNNNLKAQCNRADERIQQYEGRLTPLIVREMLGDNYAPQKKSPQDFIQYAFDYNKSCYELEKIAYSTYNGDNYVINAFRAYVLQMSGESVLPFDEITLEIFDRYKQYCLKIGNQKESINKKLKPLIKAVDYASKNELLSPKIATSISGCYFDLKSRKYASEVEDKEIHYLNPKQLQEFVNLYNTVKFDRTREFMDMFMFSFYACGLRFSDLLTIEWNHIDWEKKEIAKNLYKGKIPHNIPLVDSALKILERWKEKKYNDRFIFNLLPQNFDLENVALLDNQRKSKNRSLQTSLSELGRKLQVPLDFNLTIHVARHSFAVMALDSGVTIHMISKLLGHGSITTTEKVYAQFLPEAITEEVKTKLNFNFTPSI